MLRSNLLKRVLANQGGDLLLDTYPATAAYSLRHLRSSYSDAVVLVRRSSDDITDGFLPSEVTDGTLTSFCGAGDGFVEKMYDVTGNGNDTTQTNNSRHPKIVSSGSLITENGNPILDFDGVDDRFFTGVNIGTDFSFFLVGREKNAGNQTRMLSSVENNRVMTFNRGNASFFNNGIVIARTANIPGGSFALGTFIVGDESRGYINGNDETDNTTYTGNVWGEVVIGSSDIFNEPPDMNIAEVILYNSDQSANRSAIETNINDYYGVY